MSEQLQESEDLQGENEDQEDEDKKLKKENREDPPIVGEDDPIVPHPPHDPLAFMKGLQGEYETDLFTGAATFRYPLWLPVGRKGMTPSIGLTYSSSDRNANSLVGYGWSLPTNGIYRSTAKGIDQLYEQDDFTVEVFGEMGELISVDASMGVYSAKIETDFSEYRFQNDHWVMRDTVGTTYTFGNTEASRQSDPENPDRIYKWLLERIEDTKGNFMAFTYFHDQGQAYPETVRYAGFGNTEGIYEIRFVRVARENQPLSFQTGFKIVNAHFIQSIEIYIHHNAQPQLIRRYDLTFDEGSTVHGKLTSIQTTAENLTFPPIRFQYFDGSEYLEGKRINLLKRIDFPLGGLQELTYKPSTAYRIPAQGLANSVLPFIIHTVHTSILQDSISGEVHQTQYEYQGGHYYFDQLDAYKREYAGFHAVTLIDPEGHVRKLFFHQSEFSPDNPSSLFRGEFEDHISKKGRIFREEQFDNANSLMTTTIRRWDSKVLLEDDPEQERRFPFLAREVVISYDGNATEKALAREFDYDAYGNVTRQVEYGEVTIPGTSGSFTDILEDKIITHFQYAQNTGRHIHALPSVQERQDFQGNRVGMTRFFYDDLPLGQVNVGNSTREDHLVLTPDDFVTSRTQYSSAGLPVRTINARGFETVIEYDEFDLYPATVTNAKSHTTRYEFDYRLGVARSVTDPNGAINLTDFDALGRIEIIRTSDPQNPTQLVTKATFSYDTASSPTSVLQVEFTGTGIDVKSKTYVDGFGRTLQVRREAEGVNSFLTTSFLYDSKGRIHKELLPYFAEGIGFEPIDESLAGNTYTYDALDRVTKIANPVGQSSTQYDDWLQVEIDPNGMQKDLQFDAFGNLVEVREYLNGVPYGTRYDYDANFKLTRITDATGNVRNLQYDLLGRRVFMEDLHTPGDPTFGQWEFSYDANGNLVSQSDPMGQTIKYRFDELDRLISEEVAGSPGVDFTVQYDVGAFALGRRTGVTNSQFTTTYSYDVLGRILREQKIITGDSFATSFAYDLRGNLTVVTYPDGLVISYEYDAAGQLQAVVKGSQYVVSNLDWSPIGLVSKIEYGNGVSTTNFYDPDQMYRLTRKLTSVAGSPLQDISYAFDPVGNITDIIDTSPTSAAKTAVFGYDDLHRLTSATISNAGNGENYFRTYGYDILGNMTSHPVLGAFVYAGGNPATSSATTANPHAVTRANGTEYSYDPNGNLLSNGQWSHAWNVRNQLVKSNNGLKTLQYTYDEAGTRLTKEVAPSVNSKKKQEDQSSISLEKLSIRGLKSLQAMLHKKADQKSNTLLVRIEEELRRRSAPTPETREEQP